jgi:hypothetical protein
MWTFVVFERGQEGFRLEIELVYLSSLLGWFIASKSKVPMEPVPIGDLQHQTGREH